MKRWLGMVFASALWTAPAFAVEWRVDPAQSTLSFSSQREFPNADNPVAFTTEIRQWDAVISFDPAQPEAASLKVEMEMFSLWTDDAMSDGQMKGPDWFHIAEHPLAFYEAYGFEPLAENRYRANGALTLRSITASVPLVFDLVIENDTATALGQAEVTRTVFEVGSNAGSGLAPPIATVYFDLVAHRSAP